MALSGPWTMMPSSLTSSPRLRALALSDMSPLTSRSYGYDLLRWFRILWALDVAWERATGSEVDVLVG